MADHKKIGIKKGPFNAHDVLAVLMLRKYTRKFHDADLVYSNDPSVHEKLDALVGVGGVFDSKRGLFDFQGENFMETFSPDSDIKLSSAGLVYQQFGKEIIKKISTELLETYTVDLDITDEVIDWVFLKLYDRIIVYIDAKANGISAFPDPTEVLFELQGNLIQRVDRLNPQPYEEASYEDRFVKAMEIVDEELRWNIKDYVLGQHKYFSVCEKRFLDRFTLHSSGEIVLLKEFDEQQWNEVLIDVEKKHNALGTTKFVIYYLEHENTWRVRTVRNDPKIKLDRKKLKKEWWGLATQELREISKIDSMTFCHATGFTGGAKLFDDVMKMCTISIQEN